MGFLDFFTGDQPPLIKGALSDVCVMLDTGRDMFAASSAHLLDNEILEGDFQAQHASVTALERSVRRAVLEHLNLDPRRELVLCLKLVTVAHEGRQIGDLARTMMDAVQLSHGPRLGPHVDRLRALRKRMHALFDLARDAFMDGDPVRARTLLEQQQSVEASLEEYFQGLATMEGAARDGVVFTLAAYALKRASTHLANIAGVIISPFEGVEAEQAAELVRSDHE